MAKIAGPPNIGNYLAGLGIQATAGFGVDHQGLHSTDERIPIGSITPVQAACHQACLTLLTLLTYALTAPEADPLCCLTWQNSPRLRRWGVYGGRFPDRPSR